jgi:hypothetical protein
MSPDILHMMPVSTLQDKLDMPFDHQYEGTFQPGFEAAILRRNYIHK